MKVLLAGEYSGVHKNLKVGLEKIGVECSRASGGDGIKNFDTEIQLASKRKNYFLSRADMLIKLKKFMSFINKNQFDVVQYINPVIVFSHKLYYDATIKIMKKIPANVCLAAGCDKFYLEKEGENEGCVNCRKYDPSVCVSKKYNISVCAHDKRSNFFDKEYFDEFYNKIDKMIPIAYDYHSVYNSLDDLRHKTTDIIPLPMDTDSVKYEEICKGEKLKIYHPLNRIGCKGTLLVEEAFKILEEKYKDRAEFIIKGKMPYNEYLDFNSKVDIVVDQMYSKSYGMAALYSMAQGKIVISGNKPETKAYGGYLENCPVIDSTSTTNGLVEILEKLILTDKNELKSMGARSRQYVEEYHECSKVAKQYYEIYTQVLAGKKDN